MTVGTAALFVIPAKAGTSRRGGDALFFVTPGLFRGPRFRTITTIVSAERWMPEQARHDGVAQTQRESRSGAPAVRVFQTPLGVLYFSPGLVCRIRLQPLVKASCSTVAPLACAF